MFWGVGCHNAGRTLCNWLATRLKLDGRVHEKSLVSHFSFFPRQVREGVFLFSAEYWSEN
jgi:hypothetical protein